jgi:hypothetical protein
VVTTKVSTAMYSQSRRGSWLKFIGAKTQSFRYVCSGSSQSDGLGSPKKGCASIFSSTRGEFRSFRR